MTARMRPWVLLLLLVLLVLVAAVGKSSAAPLDTTAPTLTGFSFSPQTLDTTSGPATLTVTIQATDDLSGLSDGPSWAYVEFRNSSSPVPLSYETMDGPFVGQFISDPASNTAVVQFPQSSLAGPWHVNRVELFDNAGNFRVYHGTDLQALGFPTTVEVASGSPDTTGPTLTGLNFSSQALDTTDGPANLTVTLQAMDDLSGLKSSEPWAEVVFSFTSGNSWGIPGFIDDPTATTTILEFPRYSRSGTWHISSVFLTDNANNRRNYSESDLQALGFPTTIEMVGSSDTAGPTLTGFSFSPQSLDTTNGPANLTVTIQATDDLSGLLSGNTSFGNWWGVVEFRPRASSLVVVGLMSDPSSTTSTINWFPEYSPAGTWHVSVLKLRDNALNERVYTEADLQALGFPTTVLVNFTDVPETFSYYTQISALTRLDIVNGYGYGTFGPNNLVTRQQFAKMIVRTLDLPRSESDICLFTDVDKDTDPKDPLFPDHYVAVCAAYHITEGTSPGKFSPYGNLTRAQLITMVARAANLPEPPLDYSPPFGNFSPEHYPWARRAFYSGLLDGLLGIESAGYGFWTNASRGEVCVLLYNLLQR